MSDRNPDRFERARSLVGLLAGPAVFLFVLFHPVRDINCILM